MQNITYRTEQLAHYEEYLTKATSVKWIFHVIGTFAYVLNDPFKAERKALKFLSDLGKMAKEPAKQLEWLVRVEQHESEALHVHILLGSFKLQYPQTDKEALRKAIHRRWKQGNCMVKDINENSLAYVTKAGLDHCLLSKRVRRLARKSHKNKS